MNTKTDTGPEASAQDACQYRPVSASEVCWKAQTVSTHPTWVPGTNPTPDQLERARLNLEHHCARAARRRERMDMLWLMIPYFSAQVCAYALGLITMWLCLRP